MKSLVELAALFLKLGTIGFGGPAAHIALMDREVVERRAWLSREQFLDLVGVSNLIPGPIATQLAIHVGYRRGGWIGLIVAGVCFILPAALISTLIAWAYQQYGSRPQAEPFLHGITPVVLAIILTAMGRLGRKALTEWQLVLIATGTAAASVARYDAVYSLFAATLIGVIVLRLSRRRRGDEDHSTAAAIVVAGGGSALGLPSAVAAPGAVACAGAAGAIPLWKIFLFFLKVGAVLYGGGYVLVAYLQGGLVDDYGWLEEKQLLDAIAVGQFTPGPILSTATFVGYLMAGVAGAAVATLGIFLPSFLFVAAVGPLVPRLRRSPWTALFLDAVNAASIGLMAGVTLILARNTLQDWRSWLLLALASPLAFWGKTSSAWLVIGGALAGWLLY